MVVLIKSGPDTSEGRRGIKLARDTAADLVLLQNGVYFGLNELLDGYCGLAHAVEEDIELRGLKLDELARGLKIIGWDELTDMMAEEDRVVGIF